MFLDFASWKLPSLSLATSMNLYPLKYTKKSLHLTDTILYFSNSQHLFLCCKFKVLNEGSHFHYLKHQKKKKVTSRDTDNIKK